MIEYKDISAYLKLKIPEFDQDTFLSDYPTLLFGELSNFVLLAIKVGDSNVLQKAIGILEELSRDKNPDIIALIDEFCISMYNNSKSHFAFFKGNLSPEVQGMFNQAIELWLAQHKT